MTTKRLLSLTVIMGLLAGFALAQSDAANASLVDRLQEPAMRQELALTPKQDAKLAKIAEWEKTDLRLIGQKRMISKTKREALIREAREKSEKQARAVLTPEQLAKLGAK